MYSGYSLLFFGGTLGSFLLIQAGIGHDFRYELSVLGLVLAGWAYLIRLGRRIWRHGGGREFGLYLGKLAVILLVANAVDILAILNGAWTFEAFLSIRLWNLVTPSGLPAGIPVMEAFGFNIAIVGVVLFILDFLDLKKWL